MAENSARPARKVHPTVSLGYSLRGIVFPFSALFLFFTFHSVGGLSPVRIALLATYALVWPHVAFAWARNSRDSRRAERLNIVADSLIVGAWVAAIQYSVLPSFLLVCAMHLGNIAIGGLRLAVVGLAAMLVGMFCVSGLIGLHPHFATAPLPTGLTIIVFFFYISLYAYALHKQSKHLVGSRKEVENTNADLAHAKDEADAASRFKSMFLANMSHELRTPLNAIIGYSELLAEEAEDRGDTVIIPDLNKIRGAGDHLLGLINSVLDLSKIEAGKMDLTLEEVEVADLVASVVATVGPLVRDKGNTLTVQGSELGCMRVDVTKLRQVLFNLLGNASKFTEHGTIGLQVRREPRAAGDWLVFEVTDTGVGMTPAQQAKVFQPFVQADSSTSRKYGGTGLGLALSRRFAEMLGGDIAMTSEPGVGTTFTVGIPAQCEAAAEPVPATEAIAAGARVLVIDDSAADCDVVCRMLAREGCRAAAAHDSDAGLKLARELRPDLILLDVMMPTVDGWSVLKRLKADVRLAAIPVVVVVSTSDDTRAGARAGVADTLVKPVDRQALAQVLRKHLGGQDASAVLVIDDDAGTRRLLRRLLKRQGWAVAEAANGRVALEKLDQLHPSAILLDLMMPEMDGFDFLDALHERGLGGMIPIIVMTAKSLSPTERERLAGRAQKVLEKGRYDHRQLGAIIRDARMTQALRT
ncbi:MAG: response regulator [Rhodanobacter sp.]